ncbi:MAG: hypothetical protein R3A48_17720 [Polyangiales bacterium]
MKEIERILADAPLDDPDAPSAAEVLEARIDALGWEPVLEHLLGVLREPTRRPADWDTAAEVLWGAALDGRPLPADRVIAHLCLRWPTSAGENNLAWSLIAKLKGVEYLSPYDPLADEGVRRELARLG